MKPEGGEPATLQLVALLERQIESMEVVLSCLKTESEALEKRDIDQLLEITNQKNASLVAANKIDEQRRTLADNAMNDADNAVILERKRKLSSLVTACREQNDANGSMIRLQSRRVDNALRLLRGDSDKAAVYGPKGEPAQRSNSQTILTSV